MKKFNILLGLWLCFNFDFANSQICPPDNEISPCICSYNSVEGASLDCANIADEDQLEKIFSANFTETQFYDLTLRQSSFSELTRNVYGNVSFRKIKIRTNAILTSLNLSAFENSYETLDTLITEDNRLTDSGMKWETLSLFSNLFLLEFKNERYISIVPRLSSASLVNLIFEDSQLTSIDSFAFLGCTALQNVIIQGSLLTNLVAGNFVGADSVMQIIFTDNLITTIASGAFNGLSNLSKMQLSNSELNLIERGAFTDLLALKELVFTHNYLTHLSANSFTNLPNMLQFDVQYNNLTSIDPDTFIGFPALEHLYCQHNSLNNVLASTFAGFTKAQINLSHNNISYIEPGSFNELNSTLLALVYNRITTLDEDWLRPILDNYNQVGLYGNPLDCGCSIAWMFTSSSYYVDQIFDAASCANGTGLINLNPDYYLDNC